MLPKKSCCYCLFEDICSEDYTCTSRIRCSHFSPLCGSDAELDALVEELREQYREAWFDYIDEDDEYFLEEDFIF